MWVTHEDGGKKVRYLWVSILLPC